MKKFLIPLFLTVLILSACTTETPQATLQPVSVTDTSVPATLAVVKIETATAATVAVQPTDTTAENTPPVNFSTQVFPILNNYCAKCHGGGRIRAGLNLTTYNGLIDGSNNGPVLMPGNANQSLFIKLIEQGKMPKDGNSLSSEELQILIDWVNQGALNN